MEIDQMLLYGEFDEQDLPASERRAIEVFLIRAIRRARRAGHRIDVERGRLVIHWDECSPRLSKGVGLRFVIEIELMLESRYEHGSRDNHLAVQIKSDPGIDGDWLCVMAPDAEFPIGDTAASFVMLVLFDRMEFQLRFYRQLRNSVPSLVKHTLQERALTCANELLAEIDAGNEDVWQDYGRETLRNVIFGDGGRIVAYAIEELARRDHEIETEIVALVDDRSPEVRLAVTNYLYTFKIETLDQQLLEFLATDPCPAVAARAADILDDSEFTGK